MADRFPPEFTQQVLAHTDIVALIKQRVPLKQVGKSFQACCPFHHEKTPSFHVHADKQFYYCFGCGHHGDAITFLMAYDHVSFTEAVTTLAQQAGMPVPTATPEEVEHYATQTAVYALLEQVTRVYQLQLRAHPVAIDYLKQRGVTGVIAQQFRLGFAPPGWHFLQSHPAFAQTPVALLLQAGVIGQQRDPPPGQQPQYYDRFRDRILFPIRDYRGRVCGFGGRVLTAAVQPKYLNSPETPVFHKGRQLYGLFEARRAKHTLPYVLVVEGYMDVLALAQFGFPNSVATLGTATTTAQLHQLLQLSAETIFCFDGDSAGQAAAWKALKLALPLATGRHVVRFLRLPVGHDPDSLLRQLGPAALEQLIATALPLSEVFCQELTARYDVTTVEGRAQVATAGQELLQQVPAGPYRTLLLQRLATLVGIAPSAPPVVSPARPRPSPLTPARRAVALLRRQPELVAHIPPALRTDTAQWISAADGDERVLWALLQWLATQSPVTAAQCDTWWRETVPAALQQALAAPEMIAHIPTVGGAAELVGALHKLEQLAVKQQRSQMLRSAQSMEQLSTAQRAQLQMTPPLLGANALPE